VAPFRAVEALSSPSDCGTSDGDSGSLYGERISFFFPPPLAGFVHPLIAIFSREVRFPFFSFSRIPLLGFQSKEDWLSGKVSKVRLFSFLLRSHSVVEPLSHFPPSFTSFFTFARLEKMISCFSFSSPKETELTFSPFHSSQLLVSINLRCRDSRSFFFTSPFFQVYAFHISIIDPPLLLHRDSLF